MATSNTINVLVLCQRYGGSSAFNIKQVKNIQKDIDYIMKLNGLNKDSEIVITDFLTTGYNDPNDKMTFNIEFDSGNRKAIEFVLQHESFYNFIVIGGCPFTMFNNNNVKLLSHILKKGDSADCEASRPASDPAV